jgi:hypothetical protein
MAEQYTCPGHFPRENGPYAIRAGRIENIVA